jgi:hypothetical protein
MTPQAKNNKKQTALIAQAALFSFSFAIAPVMSFASTGHSEQLALSEIKKEELPAPGATATQPEDAETPAVTVPAPEPITPGAAPSVDDPAAQDPSEPGIDEPDANAPQGADPARPNVDPNAPVPAVEYDLSKLPAPVRELHDKLVAAAKAGLIEAVRPLLKTGEDATQLSLAGVDNDPITFLKSLSGDEGGQEILAILLEVLEAGYVHLDAGKPEELYVWPYFFAVPLDKLTDMQRVELFKLVTSGDYEDMKSFGAYIFYRVGISPDGQWRFFLAGE